MSFYDSIADAFADALQEFGDSKGVPEQVTIGGVTVDALVTENRAGSELIGGGFLPSSDFTARVLRSELASVPLPDTKLTKEGADYRILTVSAPPKSPIVEVTCGPWDR